MSVIRNKNHNWKRDSFKQIYLSFGLCIFVQQKYELNRLLSCFIIDKPYSSVKQQLEHLSMVLKD